MPRKKYYHNNVEKLKLYNKQYYESNRDTQLPRLRHNSIRYRKNNGNKIYMNDIKREHGLTQDQYNLKLIAQNHKCQICKKDEIILNKRLSLDHDHITGNIRDLLCHRCNVGIGLFGESTSQDEAIAALENAILYIKKWKRNQ